MTTNKQYYQKENDSLKPIMKEEIVKIIRTINRNIKNRTH